jgi:parvulin-like peptidyl-prolyl isomerase
MLGLTLVATALLYGCGENGPPPFDPRPAPAGSADGLAPAPTPTSPVAFKLELDNVVATVSGEPVTMRQLVDPLVRAHGLSFLLRLVQLDLAKQYAKGNGIIVTQKDFDDELELAKDRMFKDGEDMRMADALEKAVKEKRQADAELLRAEIKSERNDFLEQFLTAKHMSRIEFDMVIQTDAYLRKIADPQVRPRITEDGLHKVFGQLFGERVFVKYISLANTEQVNDVKRRLAAGEPFEKLAIELSTDRRTGPLGGELPGITRATNIQGGDAFKEAAFALRDGEVSDVVTMGNHYMLIKRIRLKPPEHVKYENVKEIVYQTLYDAQLKLVIAELKAQLEKQSQAQIQIIDTMLKGQYAEMMQLQGHADDKAKTDMARRVRLQELLRAPGTTQPSKELLDKLRKAPAATGAAPQAAPAGAGERPPAK